MEQGDLDREMGERIRAALAELDMAQEELARRLEMSAKTVGRIVNGSGTKEPTLKRIAEILGKSAQELRYGTKPSPAPAAESTLDTSTAQAEPHPVLEELLREHPELDEEVVSQLRTTYHRGAPDDFVRETFAKAILKAQRAAEGRTMKVEEKGQEAKPERQRGRTLAEAAAERKAKGG